MGSGLANTLVYVERELILPVAVKLVGSSLATKTSESVGGGINWLFTTRFGFGGESGTETRLADLFPEDVFTFAYPKIRQKNLTVREFAEAVSSRKIAPPDVVSIDGIVRFPKVPSDLHSSDPFALIAADEPETHRSYGFDCFSGVLEDNGFRIPTYFLAESAGIVYYAHEKPVEVIGVAKWTPTYEVAGHAVNCSILVAALLLRR